jgi:hypothetical protein
LTNLLDLFRKFRFSGGVHAIPEDTVFATNDPADDRAIAIRRNSANCA